MSMQENTQSVVVIAGPTASGKTGLGVRLAALLDGEILSADSRQVYRGLDIGSGKDLDEYIFNGRPIPYHLIDIADLSEEFSLFHYQKAFYPALESVQERGKLPVIVGGTGLYLDAVLSGYALVEVPPDETLREELAEVEMSLLVERLEGLGKKLHNLTDTQDRNRLVRAIEIAEYTQLHPSPPVPKLKAFILIIDYEKEVLCKRISHRLQERLDQGMIDEVAQLHESGVSWERLEQLGLEYRHVAQFLQGKIKNENDLFQKLNSSIARFAKRQRTWFRGMERKGHRLHWLPDGELSTALNAINHAHRQ